MTELMVGIGVAPERFRRQWVVERIAWERQQREEAERAAIKRREDQELARREREAAMARARVERLVGDAEAWRRAANIRAYVEAVVATAPVGAIKLAALAGGPRWLRWTGWTRLHAAEPSQCLRRMAQSRMSGRGFSQLVSLQIEAALQ